MDNSIKEIINMGQLLVELRADLAVAKKELKKAQDKYDLLEQLIIESEHLLKISKSAPPPLKPRNTSNNELDRLYMARKHLCDQLRGWVQYGASGPIAWILDEIKTINHKIIQIEGQMLG